MSTPFFAKDAPVLVVGAGIMGTGIAQVAAQAGHPVMLFDTRAGAAQQARDQLQRTLDGRVAKGKLTPVEVADTMGRLSVVNSLEAAAAARLVIEAIVEQLDVKRHLFQQLEGLVAPDGILATNTSSISVTAMANGLQRPQRLVGMHFFNPVPLMKLVEVVCGLQTDPEVADAVVDLGQRWGKVAVLARSTPGFIVNRIARPYYAEALALLQERATTPPVMDACLRGAGFRMGPCELMDLIGHDTNFSVTQSVFEANFYDRRFTPSGVQRELVEGGLLGRKTGRGFYVYPEGAPALPAPVCAAVVRPDHQAVVVHGQGAVADALVRAVAHSLGVDEGQVPRHQDAGGVGLVVNSARLMLTDGRCADEWQQQGTDVAVFDWPLRWPSARDPAPVLAYSVATAASPEWQVQAAAWLSALGFVPQRVADVPGLLVARTVCMLINEAADAVQQGVCTPEGADTAMKLGVNYPAGPFEWLAAWGEPAVVTLLDRLDTYCRGERYRVSPWLRRRATGQRP